MELLLEQVASYVQQHRVGELITDRDQLPGTCPLAVRTDGALAYFRTTENQRLEQDWRQAQTEIAGLPGERIPLRRLYLTLLVTDTPQPAPVWQHIVRDLHVCRKLVVPTARYAVQEWIEDLPFLPIPDERMRPRAIVTPAHALYRAGFKTDLVERLLAKTDMASLAKLFFTGRVLRDSREPAPEDMLLTPRTSYRRLVQMQLENFRPFASPVTLPLDADLTLIYGPNGSGKSSLAQALEWSVIGEVGTLEQANDDTRTGEDLPPYINVLHPEQPARVRLLLQDEGQQQEWELERHIGPDGVKTMAWNGKRITGMADALTRVLDADLPVTPHFSTLKAMARQSHFLDQETIRDFLSTRAQERYRALANMVGTVDFERSGEKIGHVLIAIRKEQEIAADVVRSQESRVEAETRSLADLKRQLEGLEHERGGALDLSQTASELVQAAGDLGLPVRPEIPADAPGLESFAQSLQTGLEAVRATLEERLTRLDAVVAEQEAVKAAEAALGSLRPEQESLAACLMNARAALDQQTAEVTARRTLCRNAEAALTQAEAAAREASARLAAVEALTEAGHAWMQARRTEADAAAKLAEAEALARGARQEAEAAAARAAGLVQHQTRLRHRKSVLAQLRAGLPALEEALATARTAQAEQALLAHQRDQVKAERQVVLGRSAGAEERLAELSAVLKQTEQRSAERQRLLSALSRHLESARCPLCGHDWEEAELLYQQVQAGLKDTPPELLEAQQALAREQTALVTLKAELTQLEKRLEGAEAALRERRTQEAVAAGSIRRWMDLTGQEIPLEEAGALLAQWEHDTTGADRSAELARAEAALPELQQQATGAEARRTAAQQALQDAAVGRGRAEERYQRAHGAAPADLGRPVPTPDQARAAGERQAEAARALNTAAEALHEAREQLRHAEAAEREARSTCEVLTGRQAQLTGQVRAAEGTINKQRAALAALGLGEEPGAVGAEHAQVLARLHRLDRAGEQARWLAGAARVRLLTDAAAGAEHRLEGAQAELVKARHIVSHWTEAVSLASQATAALDGARVDEQNQRLTYYEPTINEIYRRINPHPYFSVIRLQAAVESGELTMHATTPEGRSRLPVQRYFSMAQANVVALSIFLGTALLQTWSGLRLICIDDPIQQMDDVNIVAFLDVLHGVVQRGRQVVITTANKEFYQLMLKRYAYLNQHRARFRAFRLRSVNLTEGPDIAEDSPCFMPNGRVRIGALAAGS